MGNDRRIIIKESPAQTAETAAALIAGAARAVVREKGLFAVGLSGGGTPRPAHRLLAEEPLVSRMPWERTHVFWVDERCVPVNDAASNYGAAKEDFLDRVPIPSSHVHPMPSEMRPEDGARRYQEEILAFFKPDRGEVPVLDLILLGVGGDGHTASLFPGQRAAGERDRLVVAVHGGDPRVSRLTLTLPVLNRAARILFLAVGKGKARVVKRVLEDGEISLPAGKVRPVRGELVWLLDGEAATLL